MRLEYEIVQTNIGWQYSFFAGDEIGMVIGCRLSRSEAEQAARADVHLARMFTY